ncbi:MAG: hypothetical protein WBF75_04795 [Pseudonocardiaceae bacterium]
MNEAYGEVRNGIQRVQLAQGLSMRPGGPMPHTNAAAYEHPELKQMIDTSEPSQAHELGHLWNNLGNEIMEFGENLRSTATSSEAIWVGQAGNTARSALSALATWCQHTGQGVQFMGTTVRTQAEAAETAKLAMPDPVPYDPAKYQTQLNDTSNPTEWARIIGDARAQADRQHAAHAEAIRVVETYSASLHGTNAALPAFTPPPRFGDGVTGRTPGGPTPGGRAGQVVPPPVGGAGGGAPTVGSGGSPSSGGPPSSGSPPNAVGTPVAAGNQVGGHGSGAVPPSSTPGQSVSYPPGITSDGVAAGGSGAEPAGPSLLPAAAVIGGAGSGGRETGAGVRFGPRGSSGLGAWSPTPNPASSPPGRGGIGSAGTSEAGRGAGNGFPLMPGTGRAEEDREHRRPSYLIETEDIWGDGRRVAPPVIGEDPPDYHY